MGVGAGWRITFGSLLEGDEASTALPCSSEAGGVCAGGARRRENPHFFFNPNLTVLIEPRESRGMRMGFSTTPPPASLPFLPSVCLSACQGGRGACAAPPLPELPRSERDEAPELPPPGAPGSGGPGGRQRRVPAPEEAAGAWSCHRGRGDCPPCRPPSQITVERRLPSP